jgi:hypothetical protein
MCVGSSTISGATCSEEDTLGLWQCIAKEMDR